MLSFHWLATHLESLDCTIEVEAYSGLVTSVELMASINAEAGMIRSLPLATYNYRREMHNRKIFSHLYEQNELREEVQLYASVAQYGLLVLTVG